jgi:Xaa-Pro aminopeptidase
MANDRMLAAQGFTRTEYERRRQAVLAKLAAAEVDAIAVTADLHVRYLAGSDDDGVWTSPLILAPGRPATFVLRRYDEDRVRADGSVDELVTFFGEDDVVPVWADTLRALGLERARLGLELDCWGVTPRDVQELARLLPDLRIVDVSRLVVEVMDVKSDEEVAVLRRAMALTRVGVEAFYGALREGASEAEVLLATWGALVEAGSETPRISALLLGERSALPHGMPARARLEPGGVAFTELSGVQAGYCAGLVRTAVLGRNPAAEELHRVAEEAQQAAIDALRPGATTGEVDAACRGVVERAGRGETFRHRTGYTIGLGWQGRGNTSLKPGGRDIIQQGMAFHMPTILFERGRFGVGCSETVLVTAAGAEVLSGVSRALQHV